MKYLRWLMAALIAAYVAIDLMPLSMTVMHKLGRLGEVPADARRYVPLMDSMAWWQVGVWGLGIALFAAAAVQLLRGARALPFYVAAFVVTMAGLAALRAGGVYTQVFTPQELQGDYYIIAALIAVGSGVWWSERGKGQTAAAA